MDQRRTLGLEEVRQVALPYQLDIRQLQCLVEFIRMQHPGEGGWNLLSSIYDWLPCLSKGVLWQNGWVDPDAIWDREWGQSNDGCIRWGGDRRRGKGSLGWIWGVSL